MLFAVGAWVLREAAQESQRLPEDFVPVELLAPSVAHNDDFAVVLLEQVPEQVEPDARQPVLVRDDNPLDLPCHDVVKHFEERFPLLETHPARDVRERPAYRVAVRETELPELEHLVRQVLFLFRRRYPSIDIRPPRYPFVQESIYVLLVVFVSPIR